MDCRIRGASAERQRRAAWSWGRFFLDTLIDPAWAGDDAVYLAEVSGHKARYVIAELASTCGALIWILGMVGVMHLLRGRRVSLGPTFFSAGTVLGLILLAVALLRRRILPVWSPTLLLVASALWQVAGGERASPPGTRARWLGDALALVLLAAALAPLAARIWSLSDEDWERWEIPLEGS